MLDFLVCLIIQELLKDHLCLRCSYFCIMLDILLPLHTRTADPRTTLHNGGENNAHGIRNLWNRDPRHKVRWIAVALAIASVGYLTLPPFWRSPVSHYDYDMSYIDTNHESDQLFTGHSRAITLAANWTVVRLRNC